MNKADKAKKIEQEFEENYPAKLYNDIVDNYSSKFLKQLPSFSDRMWHIIMGDIFDDRAVVFVPVVEKGKRGFFLALAEVGKKGYVPLNVMFAEELHKDYHTMTEICNELTEKIFGILPKRAAIIRLRSMGAKKEEVAHEEEG